MEFRSEQSTRRLGALYTGADIVRQRARTLELLAPPPGGTCLDVGCGPGLLAVDLARAVGPDGRVVATDLSPAMVDAARVRADEAGCGPQVRTAVADATALPCEDGTIDRAAVVQVLEYVPDVPAALAELHRVLRPGGRVLALDTDWRSCVWASADRDRTDRVLRAWEEHFVHPHLPTRLAGELAAAGFTEVAVEIIPIANLAPSDDAFSRGMLGTIAGWVRRQGALGADEVEAWRADVLGHDPYFFSLCRFAFTARRPA